MKWRAVKKKMKKKKSWRDSKHLSLTGAVTVTTTDLDDLHHLDTGAAARPDGGADLQRGEARRRGGIVIAARARAATAAAPETDATALNPQDTTGATDIAATPSLQRGAQRRVIRRVEEETSDFPCFPFCFCLCGNTGCQMRFFFCFFCCFF